MNAAIELAVADGGWTLVRYIGVRDGRAGGTCPPNSGEKVFFGQTSCNIRAVDIFLEKGKTSRFFDSILFFISCVRGM